MGRRKKLPEVTFEGSIGSAEHKVVLPDLKPKEEVVQKLPELVQPVKLPATNFVQAKVALKEIGLKSHVVKLPTIPEVPAEPNDVVPTATEIPHNTNIRSRAVAHEPYKSAILKKSQGETSTPRRLLHLFS